jgi:hypothetical protein
MKKELLIVITLLLLISFVNASNHGIWLHSINIFVENSGDAEITEKFHLFFVDNDDKILFRQKSIELGSDLSQWKLFDPIFSPTIGLNNIINGKITYSEGEDNYLEIKYKLADSLMALGKETNLIEEYSIKANYLNNLFQSGLWIIPDNTIITFELPPGAELNETISPDAVIGTISTRKTITWTGYKSANRLNVKYVLWKKINPVFDLNEFNNFLFKTREGMIIILFFIGIICLIIWKRKYFVSKIESFVENNTVFEEDD